MGGEESTTFDPNLGPAIIIDVRSKQEYETGHIPSAIHINHTEIRKVVCKRWPNKLTPIKLYCASGIRASKALKILKKQGYVHVINLGGLKDAEKKLPPDEIAADLPPDVLT